MTATSTPIARVGLAYTTLRSLPPHLQEVALANLGNLLRADRQAAAAEANKDAGPAPGVWLLAGADPLDFGHASAATAVHEGSESALHVYRVIGYAPVAVKYAVLVLTDEGEEVELFDVEADAKTRLNVLYAGRGLTGLD